MKQYNFLIIGNGNWSKVYQSIIHKHFPTVNLKIADRTNWQKLIDEKPNAVIIATNPDSHVEIAKYSLAQNIPTIIEKPLSLTLKEALELSKYDKDEKNIILISNIYVFNPLIEEIKKHIDKYNSHHTCFKTIFTGTKTREKPYNDLLDYSPHAISVGIYLMNDIPMHLYRLNKTEEGNYHFRLVYQSGIVQDIICGNKSKENIRYIELDYATYIYNNKDNTMTLNISGHLKTIHRDEQIINMLNSFIKRIEGNRDNDIRYGINIGLECMDIYEELIK